MPAAERQRSGSAARDVRRAVPPSSATAGSYTPMICWQRRQRGGSLDDVADGGIGLILTIRIARLHVRGLRERPQTGVLNYRPSGSEGVREVTGARHAAIEPGTHQLTSDEHGTVVQARLPA